MALCAVLAGLLVAAARIPPARLAFTPAEPPPAAALRNFYGVEQSPRGPIRWAKPEGSITVPVSGPATYRLTLAVQDSRAVEPPRALLLHLNGVEAATVPLDGARREHSLLHTLSPYAFAAEGRRELSLEFRTGAYLPPSDPRVLGPLITGVTVEPVAPPPAWQPALILPNLLLLVVVYAALRALGLTAAWSAGGVGLLLAGYVLVVLAAPVVALELACEAAKRPLGWLATLLALGAAPLLARGPFLGDGQAGSTDYPREATVSASLRLAMGYFLVLRLAFSLAALLLSFLFALPPPCRGDAGGAPLHDTGLAFRLLGVWQRWDACRYEQIAALGYQADPKGVTFFPLFPLLLRLVSVPLAGNLTLSGLLIAAVAYIAALVGLHRLVGMDFGERVARRTIAYVSLFPSAFFLFAPFTEAPFLALAVWALYLARRGAWGWAWPVAALAGLVRLQGSLLALPLAWEAYRQWRAGERQALAPLVALAPPIGLLAFIVYCDLAIGATPFSVQSAWYVTNHLPWTVVALSWEFMIACGDPIQGLNLALFLLFGGLLALGLRRLPITYVLYLAPQLLLIGSRANFAPLNSTSRYVLALFPAFVVLALLGRRRWVHYGWLALSSILLALLFHAFVRGQLVA